MKSTPRPFDPNDADAAGDLAEDYPGQRITGPADAPPARRQRADGTWTHTTPEWDARWYWPLGMAVLVAGRAGTIIKANRVTVAIQTVDGTIHPRVPVTALTRAK